MLIVKKPDEQKDRYTRLLLCTALELYGWKDIPLFATLQNPQSTQEEIKASRRLRYNEARETEELTAINIYWSYHDTLLKVPFCLVSSTYWRRCILSFFFICYEGRRRRNSNPILPSLADESL